MSQHRALTGRSLFVALTLSVIWTVAICFSAIYSSTYVYQMFMVLGFGGLLTIFLLQFPRLYLVCLLLCWFGTAALAWLNGTPEQRELLMGGMVRSLPILALLAAIGVLQLIRRLSRPESAFVYAVVAITIPWAVSVKACLESSVTNLFDIWRRGEPQVYEWARQMPWWGPTEKPPADQAEHEARVLAAVSQMLLDRQIDDLSWEEVSGLSDNAFYFVRHAEIYRQLKALEPASDPSQIRVYRARITQMQSWVRWGDLRPASLIDLPLKAAEVRRSLEVLRQRSKKWEALAAAVKGFARGSPDGKVPWRLWMRPMLYWVATCGCYAAMLFGLLLMFRRRWIEHERLPFPWAMPALAAIRDDGSGSRKRWIAWIIGLGICVPGITYASLESGVGGPVPMIPWAGQEGLFGGFDLTGLGLLYKTPLYLYWGPFVLAMFLLFPADVLITIVVTYVFVKLLGGSILQSLGMDIGKTMLDNFFKWGVRSGGGAGLLIWGVYWHRKAIWNYLKSIFGGGQEIAEYRDDLVQWLPGLLFIVGLVGFVWLGTYATTLPMMLFLVLWILVYAYAQVRQRAEGMLFTYENNIASHQLVSLQRDFLHDHPTLVGDPQYPNAVLTSNAWGVHWLQWGFAGQLKSYGPQNVLCEIFKIAHEVKANVRQIGAGILIAMVLGALLVPPLYVKLMYMYGFENSYQEGLSIYRGFTSWSERAISYGIYSTSRVYYLPGQSNWFLEYQNVIWTLTGIGIVGLMMYLRREYVWFPLSPVGFVLAAEQIGTRMGSLSADRVWFSFLLAWVIKTLVFRWLGVRYYNERIVPLILYALCGMMFGMLLYILRYVSLGKGFLI